MIHSCSYHCDRPECIKAQRDELRDRLFKREWVGLDNDDLIWIYSNSNKIGQAISNTETKLKEKNQ